MHARMFWNPKPTQLFLTMSVPSHTQMDFFLHAQKQLFLNSVKLHTSGSAYSTSNPCIVYVVIASGNSTSLIVAPKSSTSFWSSSGLFGLHFRFLVTLLSQITRDVSVPEVSAKQDEVNHRMLKYWGMYAPQYSLLSSHFLTFRLCSLQFKILKKQTTNRKQEQWTAIFLDVFLE